MQFDCDRIVMVMEILRIYYPVIEEVHCAYGQIVSLYCMYMYTSTHVMQMNALCCQSASQKYDKFANLADFQSKPIKSMGVELVKYKCCFIIFNTTTATKAILFYFKLIHLSVFRFETCMMINEYCKYSSS